VTAVFSHPPTMVAFLPVVSVGLTGLTLAFFIYPRLPHYSFQIRSASPRWYQGEGFRAILGANVQLKNDNYVAIDIHALSFDLYYDDWWGETQLLANVQDTRLREVQTLHEDEDEVESYPASEEMDTEALVAAESPIWKLLPRERFETYDHVLMEPIAGLSTVANLLYGMILNWGTVPVRSSGAVQLKANGKVPLTLNILCDNLLNGFTLEVKGVHCELHRLDIGWKDIPSAMILLGEVLLKSENEAKRKLQV
jgi:hypothetical protein